VGWERLRSTPERWIVSLFLVGTETCVGLYKREARIFFGTELRQSGSNAPDMAIKVTHHFILHLVLLGRGV
jgi:hypothetical protein